MFRTFDLGVFANSYEEVSRMSSMVYNEVILFLYYFSQDDGRRQRA